MFWVRKSKSKALTKKKKKIKDHRKLFQTQQKPNNQQPKTLLHSNKTCVFFFAFRFQFLLTQADA